MLTLSEIVEITQALGSGAVVLSLAFVCVQLHRNTMATRASSHHAITEALNQVNLIWARDRDLTRIWLAGLQDRAGLTAEERWRFDSMLRAYFHVCETMYIQAALGAGEKSIVTAEEAGIRSIMRFNSVRIWWDENPFGFSTAFRKYVANIGSL